MAFEKIRSLWGRAKVRGSKREILAIGIGTGAVAMFLGLWLVFAVDRCAGLSLYGLSFLDECNCSNIGRYRLFKGIWVDGYEDARFFPDQASVPRPIPATDAYLSIDEAASDMIHRSFPAHDTKVMRDIIAIEFWGNERRPYHPGFYRRNFVVRRVVTAKIIRTESN